MPLPDAPNMRMIFLIVLLTYASFLNAEGETLLEGRLVLKGDPPESEVFDLGRDTCCIEANPQDERWIVGADGGLANVVISLRVGRNDSLEPLKQARTENKLQFLTNKDCRFEPRVLLMQTGQTLRLANDDPTTHNVAATFGRNTSLNVVLAPKMSRDFLLDKPERKPMPVSCNIHPYMSGYVFVVDHPYMAISDKEGRFSISNLPEGDWEFQFWHEGKYLEGLSYARDGKDFQTDQRGRTRLLIEESSQIDLGEIAYQPLR